MARQHLNDPVQPTPETQQGETTSEIVSIRAQRLVSPLFDGY